MTFLKAAEAALTSLGRPARPEEIVKIATDRGNLVSVGRTPAATMEAALAVAVRDGGTNGVFVRTEPGVFGLTGRDMSMTPRLDKKPKAIEPANQTAAPKLPEDMASSGRDAITTIGENQTTPTGDSAKSPFPPRPTQPHSTKSATSTPHKKHSQKKIVHRSSGAWQGQSKENAQINPPPRVTAHIKFFPNDPTGIREISTGLPWHVTAMQFPRTAYPEVRSSPEMKTPCVYILLKADAATKARQGGVYWGKSTVPNERLQIHARKKMKWVECICFAAGQRPMGPGTITYLEARLIAMSQDLLGKVNVVNKQRPRLPALSEDEEDEAAHYLHQIIHLLPILGITVLYKVQPTRLTPEFHIAGKGVEAWANRQGDGLVVTAHSQAVLEAAKSCPKITMRDNLIAQGILKRVGGKYEFTKDQPFTSPSAAAAVVLGGSIDGQKHWHNEQRLSLREANALLAAR